ncbi:MAG TPA: polysaccharide biosynthesis protein GumE [Cellvibrio sp.]|nr:polysaccharide biosynthesis protein GumE [Cellvibrio sp.]
MNYQPACPSIPPLPTQWQPVQERRWLSDQRLLTFIIVASVGYQAVLCLVNNFVIPASRPLVGLAEAIILLACAPMLMRRLLPGVVALACVAAAILCVLGMINEQLNIKAFRDIAIPLCYFWLGCNVGKPDMADRALKAAIWVVIVLGMFELLFVDQYTELFDIFGYYVNIGALLPVTEYVRESKLQFNGIRPEGIGRTLLPSLLGPHRVSSVFLEPVSLGNFATLCAAWGISRDREEWRKGVFFVCAAIFLMVLADSRFALMTVSLFVAMRIFLQGKSINLAIFAPIFAVGMLIAVGLSTKHEVDGLISDDLNGRLAYSGWSLMEFDLPMLMATNIHDAYPDVGYAHMLSTFGLPLCLIFWLSLWILPMPNERSMRFRALVSVYVALILCISGSSFFALKSAGLLWFLVGCCMLDPAPVSGRSQSGPNALSGGQDGK